jgi:YbbR domain-containing protein
MAWHPFRNFGLKAVALGLGTLLWLTVSGHQIERRLLVPVLYSNIPQPLALTGEEADQVNVYVRGEDNRVSALDEGDIRIVLNLDQAHSGENLVSLGPEDVVAPLGIEVLQVDPGSMTVRLERMGRTSVVVRPAAVGMPMAGMRIISVTAQPASVTVEGPETLLLRPVSLVTPRLDVTGRATTFSQDVEVGVADALLRVVQPRTVRVTVHIGPEAE